MIPPTYQSLDNIQSSDNYFSTIKQKFNWVLSSLQISSVGGGSHEGNCAIEGEKFSNIYSRNTKSLARLNHLEHIHSYDLVPTFHLL